MIALPLPPLPWGLAAPQPFVLVVFTVVYLGMVLGGLPRLMLDRTGVALLGAIAIVGGGVLTIDEAARAVHLPTILLLFAFMVISAQMRLGGFYTRVTQGITALAVGPTALLAVVIGAAGALSAVFSNDIVCLAMAPVLADACLRRRLDPIPFLLALACASNIGSAATLIGNPQNMLIGQRLGMDFGAYLAEAIVPVLLGLVALWGWLAVQGVARAGDPGPEDAARIARLQAEAPPYDRWQTAKGLAVAGALMVIFLATDWPHDVAALVGAGALRSGPAPRSTRCDRSSRGPRRSRPRPAGGCRQSPRRRCPCAVWRKRGAGAQAWHIAQSHSKYSSPKKVTRRTQTSPPDDSAAAMPSSTIEPSTWRDCITAACCCSSVRRSPGSMHAVMPEVVSL
jgi:hypothetical protein